MSSFIVRIACERFVKPDKLIVMGTGGPNPASGAGIALTSIIKLFKGDRHISQLVYDLAFGGYNTKFKGDADYSKKSWLSTDLSIRQKYMEDDYCTFKFTVGAMGDLMKLLQYSNRGAWFKNIPDDLPMLLISGADDPVGAYGKGILQVEKMLKKHGKDVRSILYKGARHEILNEFTYDDVKKDIMDFLV
jgi:alpha-beta hydrolase superfamily lysophospholipase